MTENALERRAGTDLEQVEAWASLDAGERRRRTAEAVRDDDREALAGLLAAWLRLYGRGGLHTSARTVDVYGRGMDRLLAWCARSARKAHRVDASDARRFVAWMQAEGLADKSVATYLTAARVPADPCRMPDAPIRRWGSRPTSRPAGCVRPVRPPRATSTWRRAAIWRDPPRPG